MPSHKANSLSLSLRRLNDRREKFCRSAKLKRVAKLVSCLFASLSHSIRSHSIPFSSLLCSIALLFSMGKCGPLLRHFWEQKALRSMARPSLNRYTLWRWWELSKRLATEMAISKGTRPTFALGPKHSPKQSFGFERQKNERQRTALTNRLTPLKSVSSLKTKKGVSLLLPVQWFVAALNCSLSLSRNSL